MSSYGCAMPSTNEFVEHRTSCCSVRLRDDQFNGTNRIVGEKEIMSEVVGSFPKVQRDRSRRNHSGYFRSEHEDRIIAYHEAGHTVVAWRLPNGPTVIKATIESCGNSRGYVTWRERSRFLSHDELFDKTCAELGGMAAESIFLGRVAPLSNARDLQDANESAAIATTKEFSQLYFRIRPELKSVAKSTLTQTLICEAYSRARAVLRKHEDEVHNIATALLLRRTLTVVELRRILESSLPIVTDLNALKSSYSTGVLQHSSKITSACPVSKETEAKYGKTSLAKKSAMTLISVSLVGVLCLWTHSRLTSRPSSDSNSSDKTRRLLERLTVKMLVKFLKCIRNFRRPPSTVYNCVVHNFL